MSFCAKFYEDIGEILELLEKEFGEDFKEITRITCDERQRLELTAFLNAKTKQSPVLKVVCTGNSCTIGVKIHTSLAKANKMRQEAIKRRILLVPSYSDLFGVIDRSSGEIGFAVSSKPELEDVERKLRKLLNFLKEMKIEPKIKVKGRRRRRERGLEEFL